MSIGVKLAGGRLGVIIPKHTPIPCDGEKDYVNEGDFKEVVGLEVYQGDNPDGGDYVPIEDCDKIADMCMTGFG